MNYRVKCYNSYDQLPRQAQHIVEQSSGDDFFSQPEWLLLLMREMFSEGSELALCALEDCDTGSVELLAPLRYTLVDGAVSRARALCAISHVENYCEYGFILSDRDAGQPRQRELITALFRALANGTVDDFPGPVDALRLCPFAVDSRRGLLVRLCMQDAGFWVQPYANSHNFYEQTTGLCYDDYMAKRSANQRYNNRRKRRNLEAAGELELSFVSSAADPERLERAIEQYILVSVDSWKNPDSNVSKLILETIRLAAQRGDLRLGVLSLDGRAIAVQFWVYSQGVAYMMRNSYREDCRSLSPGVVLMASMIENLLNEDGAECLDFGYGDDAYKEQWLSEYRYYCGMMGFNRRTVLGVLYACGHFAGGRVKRILRKFV